ncbi:DUF2760 domain-containing protein [Tautonia sociabilis]|uniref:DUF2760 domain-containing protein n=1 Tax=Tautonia sociabilis TaxID=2080755 RepID=A0A432MMY8_9BACT|nr:DUF2760 domain-containing protein [Tautonia sociabilis]RUL88428.1 DUF2760 domain-containing protein [Tautonia sociabilis]
MNRLMLALRAFWQALTDPEQADRIRLAIEAPKAEGPDLRILALLQRDGRLIDFLQEEIGPYSDEQIGAAVRDIHKGCRSALAEYLTIAPVLDRQEGDPVTIPTDFDPAAVRLLGKVSGAGPFDGVLKHHGWRVTAAKLPAIPPARDGTSVLAPAEVEIS